MLKKLIKLANELDELGEHEIADKLDEHAQAKAKRLKLEADPLTLAVALGLLNPSVLEPEEDEKMEEEDFFSETLNSLRER